MSATTHIPPQAQLSEAAEDRNAMVIESMIRLQHRAYRAIYALGKTNIEVMVVCIEVDSCWRGLVEKLMPGNEAAWQRQRAAGIRPIALGSVMWSFTTWLAEHFPDLKDVITEEPNEGMMKCAILNGGGCTIIDIEPKLDPNSVT